MWKVISLTNIKYISKAFFSSRLSSVRSYRLKLTETFWCFRAKKNSLRFWYLNNVYQLRNWFSSQSQASQVFFSIFTSIIIQTVLSLLFILVIMEVDKNIISIQSQIELLLPESVITLIPRINLKMDAYLNLLGVLAQLSGVFLGLYFTAITVLASTIYSKVPSDVRQALIREKSNNTYFDIVVLFGVYSTLLLGFNTLGFQTGIINLIIALVLFFTAMIGFSTLAIRAFNFFDPTRLTIYLITEILKRIKNVTPQGAFWRNTSFQNHYRQETWGYICTFNNIASLSKREDFNFIDSKSLYELCNNSLYVIEEYLTKKSSIPIDSFWFQRSQRHRSWFLSSSTSQGISLNANIPLFPEQIIDYLWFERELITIFEIALEKLLERQDNYISILPNIIGRVATKMGEKLAFKEAFLFLDVLNKVSLQYIQKSDVNDFNKSNEASIAMADIYYYALISILLGISKKMEQVDKQYLENLTAHIKWTENKYVFNLDIPTDMISCLEKLREKILFEFEAEGKRITPQWYINQLLANETAVLIKKICESVTEKFESYLSNIEYMLTNNKFLIATQAIQRGLEICRKSDVHLAKIKDSYDSISQLRTVSDIPWPEIDWEAIEHKIDQTEEKLLICLSSSLLTLVSVKRDKTFPDYFGFAYSTLIQRCYDSLFKSNERLFVLLFPSLFFAGFKARERLIEEIQNLSIESQFTVITGPLLDIIELSGYTIIYSELEKKNYWQPVEVLWRQLFDDSPDPDALLQLLLGVIEANGGSLAISARDSLRSDWSMKLRQKFVQAGVLRDRYAERVYNGDEDIVHESPIIRAMGSEWDLVFDAKDVFVAIYLSTRPGFVLDRMNWQTKHFYQSLQREQQRGEGND